MPHGTSSFGDVEVTVLCDVETEIALAEVFDTGEPPGGVATIHERFPDDFGPGTWRFRAHCFAIRTPGGMVLVDTGVGTADAPFAVWAGAEGRLPDELRRSGIALGDVDHVVITHAHSDHIGWNTVASADGFEPLFPNARYHLHEADRSWALGFDDVESLAEFERMIAPLERTGQLALEAEDLEVVPGVYAFHAPGHTPGHRCVEVALGDERLLLAGDLLHFTFQLEETEFHPSSDADPELASRTRAALLDRVEAEGLLLGTAHLPVPIGRLERIDGARILRPR